MTDSPYRVLGIVGSLRRDSFNRRLLDWAAKIAPAPLQIEVDHELLRLPLFDEDLEVDGGYPPEVEALHERIRAADAVLLATPEYNFGIPGPVKNLVDWASRPPMRGPLVAKPIALIGASTGRLGGTVQAQGQLRISLASTGAHVLPWPSVLVAEAHKRFDGDELTDEMTAKVLGMALDRLVELVAAVSSPR